MNAITYKEVFPLIKDNKMWLGESIHSGNREFGVPKEYPLNAAGWRIDEDGNHYIRVKGVRWFTNLEHGCTERFMQGYGEFLTSSIMHILLYMYFRYGHPRKLTP